jgi:hypothetical protein
MKTIREQREERRQVKLKHVRGQVKSGKLVVRQMTAEERDGSLVQPRRFATPESAGS